MNTPTRTKTPGAAVAAANPAARPLVVMTDSDREQVELVKKTVAVGATDSELQLFLYQAKRLGLDPLLGQIKFVKRRRRNRETGEYEDVGTIMVGIDGLRVLAERTGKYAGQDEPEFEERGDEYPYACTVRVYRKDFEKPVPAKLFWREYAPFDRNGQPMGLWGTKPRFMLSKCTEAGALRKAFPADLSGLYTEEEFDQDRGERPRAPRVPDRPRLANKPAAPANGDPDPGDGGAIPTTTGPAPAAPAPAVPVAPAAPAGARATSPRDLIARAARAEGYKGNDPVEHWLHLHYMTPSLDGFSADDLAHVREHALSVITAAAARAEAPEAVAAQESPTPDAAMPSLPSKAGTDATGEPEALTPEDAHALRALIANAATAEGLKSARAWAVRHYGKDLSNKKLEDITPDLRARMRADALQAIATREQATNGTPAPTNPSPDKAAPATSGNGEVKAPANLQDESLSGLITATQPATADQLETIRRESTIRGIVNPERDSGVRQSARREIQRLEELTQAQADRVIRYLKFFTPIQSQHTAPPA